MQLQTAYQWLIFSKEECPSSYVLYETKLSVKASQSGLNYEWSRSSLSISPTISWKWNTSKLHIMSYSSPLLLVLWSMHSKDCWLLLSNENINQIYYQKESLESANFACDTSHYLLSLQLSVTFNSRTSWKPQANTTVSGSVSFPANVRRY